MDEVSEDVPICSLRFTHPTATADEIVNALNLQPEFRWTRGEQKRRLDGRPNVGVHKYSYCSFRVLIHSADSVESDACAFLRQLESHREEIERLSASGAELALYAVWTYGSPKGFVFGVEFLRMLASLKVGLMLEPVGGPGSGARPSQ